MGGADTWKEEVGTAKRKAVWDACVFRGHCYSLESSEITSRLPLKLSTLPTKLCQVRVQCTVEEVNGMLVNSCWTAIIRKWAEQIQFGE